jgi:predicted DNA-binding transcriptional regulator AlpA
VRQWVFNGPEQDWFTKSETVAAIGVTDKTLDGLIKRGLFPRGVRATPRSRPRWSGADIAAYLYLRSRCWVGEEQPPKRKKSRTPPA